MSRASTKEREMVQREGVLAAHVRASPSASFNTATLARSYALPAERVAQIVKRNGGTHE